MLPSFINRSTLKRILRWGSAVTVVAALVGAVSAWIYVERTRAQLPHVTELTDLNPKYGTTVRGQNGTHLGGQPASEAVDYDELPPKLIAAFLAAEDEDFFTHRGYNTRSIGRAIFENYRAGETVQGASTITQQVAKHFLEPEKTWRRKLREFLLAREIEDRFTKQQILEAYLGGIYFGQNAYGITQASHTYFSVPPDELTTGQIAVLAGLLPAPSDFNPVDNPDLALRERDRVLRRMHDIGILDDERHQQLVDQPLETLDPKAPPRSPAPEAEQTIRRNWQRVAGDGTDWHQSQLEIVTTHHPGYQQLARQALQRGIEEHDRRRGYRGPPARTGDAEAFDDRLDTLDEDADITLARVDEVTSEELTLRLPGKHVAIDAEHLEWIGGFHPRTERPRQPDVEFDDVLRIDDVVFARGDDDGWNLWQPPVHEGAFLVADHHSGETLASVGAYDVDQSQFNRAEQACRQPGSLFKTIVYAEAFSADITPATLLSDVPTDIGAPDGVWQPRNADRDFRGYLTALDAFVASRNISAAHLFEHLGPTRIIDRAEAFGIDSFLDPAPSLALGASCTTVGEMLDTHATIARGGYSFERHHVAYVRDLSTGRIEDHGHFAQRDPAVVPRLVRATDLPPVPPRVVDPEVNHLMTTALRDVVTRGTASELPSEWPLAAKTGTSDDFDTWIVTFDPQITSTIWIGSDRNTDPFLAGELSSTVALPGFAHFYEGLANDVDDWPPDVDGETNIEYVRIDPATGLRARAGERGIQYPFVEGTAPEEYAPTEASRQLEQFDSLTY